VRFRDWVPHLFADGLRVWHALDALDEPIRTSAAAAVLRQVLNTAQVTAPPDLWLMRQVVSALDALGLLEPLQRGVVVQAGDGDTRPDELRIDLGFLLSRGVLVRQGDGWRAADNRAARSVLALRRLPTHWPADLSQRWARALDGHQRDVPLLLEICQALPALEQKAAPAWVPNGAEVELGWRLVPLVLGLRTTERILPLIDGGVVDPTSLAPLPAPLCDAVTTLLEHTGAIDATGHITPPGARMLRRGPGPFGIIEAYHPYLTALPTVLREGRGAVHVQRGTNVAASQDANRRTFARANDALDRFCADTGFTYTVFVEHAVGRGEAIRQRWERSGDALAYVGADLEAEALSAARDQRDAGRLPADLALVQADIGEPDVLVAALTALGHDPATGVMVVGNGFHEVRGQTDERMVAVFEGYARAGLVLLFTEESALALDDLLQTAWNTYHAGFRYVHERSGQGLRPAMPQPPSRLGKPLPASWAECATRAGYVRVEAYCGRSRTIYPHTPPSGLNPSISVNHFFVPSALAGSLSL
jgi:hypothetical protein